MFGLQETPFDLRFRIGSIPVRVQPLFWIIIAALGWGYFHAGLGYLLLWIACCFVSVLLHELGHVWTGMAFGTHGYIVLWSFGGLAVGSSDLAERWKRVAVYLAGPGIQLILYAILYLIEPWIMASISPDWERPVGAALHMLLVINLFWALLNLLPVWPMDGGKVTREACVAASRARESRRPFISPSPSPACWRCTASSSRTDGF